MFLISKWCSLNIHLKFNVFFLIIKNIIYKFYECTVSTYFRKICWEFFDNFGDWSLKQKFCLQNNWNNSIESGIFFLIKFNTLIKHFWRVWFGSWEENVKKYYYPNGENVTILETRCYTYMNGVKNVKAISQWRLLADDWIARAAGLRVLSTFLHRHTYIHKVYVYII